MPSETTGFTSAPFNSKNYPEFAGFVFHWDLKHNMQTFFSGNSDREYRSIPTKPEPGINGKLQSSCWDFQSKALFEQSGELKETH